MTLAFGAALLLVFFVLLYLNERWSVAVCTLLPAIGAASASLVGLWLTGIELNITAMMGLIMVVGIVTEVSVFLVFEVEASHLPSPKERIWQAVLERARPIVMTSIIASLALAPIAAGHGEGSEMLRPMAITIISGLVVKLPLALIVLPASLQWVDTHFPPKSTT
jgi:multidrug efflux pump subunit AcrB